MIAERDKYVGIYSTPDRMTKYGHSNHGKHALRFLEKWNPESVVDVGCGWNEFADMVRPKCRAVGVDFACPGADVQAPADELPFGDKSFDVLTSFDMLEHLREEEVPATLREFARVSKRFILSISYAESVNKWKGETLHPTVKPEEWWLLELVRAGAVAIAKHGRYITGTWSPMLKIKPESSVILVGNGPSILKQEQGQQIDSFDEVIRFNNYHIEGFERHTGAKTTLWGTFFKQGESATPRHHRVICSHENDKPILSCTESYYVASIFYQRIRTDVIRRARWHSGFTRECHHLLASSGLMVASWLLDVVGVRKLTLAGFDHFDKNKSSRHHYWIDKAFKAPTEHDGQIEAEMFRELQVAGRVNYI